MQIIIMGYLRKICKNALQDDITDFWNKIMGYPFQYPIIQTTPQCWSGTGSIPHNVSNVRPHMFELCKHFWQALLILNAKCDNDQMLEAESHGTRITYFNFN